MTPALANPPLMTLRDYQQDAVDSLFKYWADGGGDGIIEMATGLGKSLVLAEIIRRMSQEYPQMRMIAATHVKELISQNFDKLNKLYPYAPAGIYSAGLRRRDTRHKIIYAGIQSVVRRAEQIGERHLMLVDECHLISTNTNTSYQRFITDLRGFYPQMKIVGLTATPYRLDSGSLIGENRMFDDIVYSYDVGRGIEDGWLSPIVNRAPACAIDTSNVKVRGGEYLESDLIDAVSDEAFIRETCIDALSRCNDRKSLLFFCTGVNHSHSVVEMLRNLGCTAEAVLGETPAQEREDIIGRYKRGEIRALVGANVLSVGFDAPETDAVIVMRATLSTGLFVQMVGRGTRITESVNINKYATAAERRTAIAHSSKPNCLLLDYGGNLQRHGPLNLISRRPARAKRDEENENVKECNNPECGDSAAVEDWAQNKGLCPTCQTKQCKSCREWVDIELWEGEENRTCPKCGHEHKPVPREITHENDADEHSDVLAPTEIVHLHEQGWREVTGWSAQRHGVPLSDKPNTLRITYDLAHGAPVSEWICFDHPLGTFPRGKAEKWWRDHGGEIVACDDVAAALEHFSDLKPPRTIRIEQDGKWDRVVSRRFGKGRSV